MTVSTARTLSLPIILLLTGCGSGDDFARPGTWRPGDVNDANLAAMLADPRHAVRGVIVTTERGQPASLAITRLEQDRRRPLPDSRAALIGAVGGNVPTGPAQEPANSR